MDPHVSLYQPVLSLVQHVGDVLQVGVEHGSGSGEGVDAVLSVISESHHGLLCPAGSAREVAVLCNLQRLVMSVAEGPESPPGCTTDSGEVGGEGRSGVVCRDGPVASKSILISDVNVGDVLLVECGVEVVVRVVVGSHSVAQLLQYAPK